MRTPWDTPKLNNQVGRQEVSSPCFTQPSLRASIDVITAASRPGFSRHDTTLYIYSLSCMTGVWQNRIDITSSRASLTTHAEGPAFFTVAMDNPSGNG